ISTLTFLKMSIDPLTEKIIYLANIFGSDIGLLLLPIGTLATLIWMHIIRQHGEKVSWSVYIKTTIIVVPLTVVYTITVL
ncbi:ArsB/NhaD family transporter, partial [Lysinibacillus sp. D4A1_S13]|uniref:ArsB/NhaD family transporter n=1 Tax=Lysinibacillus sp. D4A1_S13 TaxID=2941228 RepID=UPI0024BE321F